MGEVYRAIDTSLDRSVAIKVLPEAVASDPERLARFDREARTLAALNHPGIAQIYGVERTTAEGGRASTTALVMELVEGETLAEVLGRAGSRLNARGTGGLATHSGLPIDEALTLARQIAEALEAAHEHGIVHRDLKPANVKVTPDGVVKVLDFGLAKAVEAVGGGHAPDNPSLAPTITTPAMTQAGVVLGTAAYMSPEQAKGKPVDKRADIWAFGCVLWEMLTGRRLFSADDVTETLALVLTAAVDWDALPADTPPSIRRLLERCLDRDARRRLRDMGEARLVLENPLDAGWALSAGAVPARPAWGRTGLLAGGALLVGIVAGGLAMRPTTSPTAPPVRYLDINLDEGQVFTYPGRRYVAISPSGTHVAYTAPPGLWLRALGEAEARIVPGTQGDARSPFFSPDGESLGYWATGALWQVSLSGGAPTRIVEAVNPWSAQWAEDGTILYGQGPMGIWRVPSTGGEPEQVISLAAGENSHGPQLLPGGEWVLFTLLPPDMGLWDRAQIVAQSLVSNERKVLVNRGRDARYLPTGHLVYVLNGQLLAVPFDVDRLEAGTAAVPLLDGIEDAFTLTGAAQFDVAESGDLVYVPSWIPDTVALTWVDRDGREEPVGGEARDFRHPRVSPDGTRIAVEIAEPNDTNVWVGDRTGIFTPLTLDAGYDGFPTWSPDGLRIVFFSARNGGGLFARSAGGTGTEERIVDGAEWRPSGWAPDDGLFYERLAGAAIQVRAPGTDGDAQEMNLVDAPDYFDILHPAVSPNGRWLAYHSSESGRLEVYVRPFPDVGDARRQISTAGGYSPVWSPDGEELYYIRSNTDAARPGRLSRGTLDAVRIDPASGRPTAAPEPLFSLRDFVFFEGFGRHYDIAPDGRFLMLKDTSPGPAHLERRMVLVQGWLQDLQRRVPATD